MPIVRRALVGLALVLVLGCSSDPATSLRTVFDPCAPLALVPDPTATAADRSSMALAIDLWRSAAFVQTQVDATSGAPAATPRLPIHFQAAAGAFHGLYDDRDGEIFVNQSFVADSARTITIAHELGHAFGLLHVPASERASLMNPNNTTVLPTALDVATLAASWGRCPPPNGAVAAAPP
jgi:hypothetical protein